MERYNKDNIVGVIFSSCNTCEYKVLEITGKNNCHLHQIKGGVYSNRDYTIDIIAKNLNNGSWKVISSEVQYEIW